MAGGQAKNEELARKSAAISEEDLESMRAEFEERLGAAERKVYALTKERDALRRGTEKLNSANDLVKEKDAIIQQVLLAPVRTGLHPCRAARSRAWLVAVRCTPPASCILSAA
jgi:hypothetical protein